MESVTPMLKWAGGKRWLIPRLRELLPASYDRLVEPFAGGLAVTLALRPGRALLNDANQHLVNFYRHVQTGLVNQEIPFLNDAAAYASIRTRFNALATHGYAETAEAALCFYYLNRTGFNGLCRFNRRGEFNVPFGRYKTIRYLDDAEFARYRQVLQPWQFTTGDFEALDMHPRDLVYADPPYDTPFTQYAPGGFSWADQVRCAQWLAAHPGAVIASNQATPRIVELYTALGFTIELLDAPRRISCNGNRDSVKELLATKNR